MDSITFGNGLSTGLYNLDNTNPQVDIGYAMYALADFWNGANQVSSGSSNRRWEKRWQVGSVGLIFYMETYQWSDTDECFSSCVNALSTGIKQSYRAAETDRRQGTARCLMGFHGL